MIAPRMTLRRGSGEGANYCITTPTPESALGYPHDREPSLNLAYTLYRTARRLPRAIAVIERDRIELSYEDLAARTLALAGGLQAQGVRAGDRVFVSR